MSPISSSAEATESGSAHLRAAPQRTETQKTAAPKTAAPKTRTTSSGLAPIRPLLGLFLVLTLSSHGSARELWLSEEGDDYINLNSALKSVILIARPRAEGATTTASNFWRGRSTLEAGFDSWLAAQFAYEQRAILVSSDSSEGQALLPPSSDLPYQVAPLGNYIVEEPTFDWAHGIDRAALTLRGDWGRAIIGRQAIGFGRANFFSVVDVLSPFGTFQVDQEWKSGVDAFDIEWQVSPQWSVGFTEAAERDFSDAAFLGRTTYNFGSADLLLIFGKRSEDWMFGGASSWTLADAEFHGEFATFFTNGEGVPQAQLGKSTVLKGVFGGSYSFDVLAGLSVLGEYHFNGFGLSQIEEQQINLGDPSYLSRFARGDFQTLGQHEVALSLNLTVDELIRGYGYAVVSPQDASGLFAVGATMDASDTFSLDLSGFVPWGKQPSSDGPVPRLRSEYGGSPMALYLSMRFYD